MPTTLLTQSITVEDKGQYTGHLNIPATYYSVTFKITNAFDTWDIDLYVGLDYTPNPTNYTYKSNGTSDTEIIVIDNITSGMWYFNVYSFYGAATVNLSIIGITWDEHYAEHAITDTGDDVIDDIDTGGTVVDQLTGSVTVNVTNDLSGIFTDLDGIMDDVSFTVVDGVDRLSDDVSNALSDISGAIYDAVNPLIDGIGDAISGVGDDISAAVIDAVDFAAAGINGAYGAIIDSVESIAGAIGEGIDFISVTIKDVIDSAIDSLSELAETLFTYLFTLLIDAVSTAGIKAVEKLWDSIFVLEDDK